MSLISAGAGSIQYNSVGPGNQIIHNREEGIKITINFGNGHAHTTDPHNNAVGNESSIHTTRNTDPEVVIDHNASATNAPNCMSEDPEPLPEADQPDVTVSSQWGPEDALNMAQGLLRQYRPSVPST